MQQTTVIAKQEVDQAEPIVLHLLMTRRTNFRNCYFFTCKKNVTL